MQFTPRSGGACELIYGVANESECDSQLGGWYYGAQQTEIRICPATCDRLSAERGRVGVLVGCPPK